MNDLLRSARGSGLSWVQMAVLLHLHYRGPREVMACGELLQLSPAGASQMIERLVQGGLVQRSETPDDRHVRLVHLTAAQIPLGGQQTSGNIVVAGMSVSLPLLHHLENAPRCKTKRPGQNRGGDGVG
jgi:predicted transcriptional regulator